MIPFHIQQYLSFSSKSIIIARIILCFAILTRAIERLWFFLSYKNNFPSLYNYNLNPFHFENFSIINGSIILVPTLYILLILASVYFIINKSFHKTNTLILFFLITLTSLDPIYIGKGLRIFWPLLIFFFSLPKIPIFNFQKNIHYYNPFINIPIFLFVGLIYFFSFYFKSDPVWTNSYKALWYFLKSEQWTLNWARPLTNFPNLLKFATVSTLFLEASAILLFLFSGFKFIKFKHSFKNIFSILFIIFHGIISFITVLKAFSFGMVSFWVLFLKQNISNSNENFKVNKIDIALMIYVFLSLFIWNLFPRDLNTLNNNQSYKVLIESFRKITIPQYWGLVSPAPGFHNWEVKIFSKSSKDDTELSLLNSKKNSTNKYFSDAFFTAAFKENSLLDIYKRKFCKEDSDKIIFKYYKNRIITLKNKSDEIFTITKNCKVYPISK